MFILKQLARRSIRDKLIMGFSLIFLLMVIIVATSIVLVSRIERNSNVVKNISFPQALKSLEIESLITQIVYGIDYSRGSATMEGMEKAKKGKEELNNEFRLIKESFSGNDFILDIISNIENNFKEFYALGEEIVKYNIYQEWGKIPPLIERYDKLHATLLEDVSKLKQGGVDGLNDAVNNINLITRYTKRINVIMGVIGLVFIVFLTFIISLSIIKPIGMLRNLMMRSGSGDLTEKYENEYLEKCWAKTGCNNTECQSFESGNLRCWQASGTFSRNDEENSHRAKKIKCIECEVYKRATYDEIAVIGETFNNMIYGLKKIFAQVKKSVKAVALASGEIKDISVKISQGSQSQSQSIIEVSSSMDKMDTIIKEVVTNVENLSSSTEESTSSIMEMSASIDQVTESAENLSTNVDETSSSIEEMTVSMKQIANSTEILVGKGSRYLSAGEGGDEAEAKIAGGIVGEGAKSVQRAVEGIKKIKDVVLESAEVIKKLGEKSENIGEILTVISDVAEQTNLLALNAAIIAAQAGEHGRGFAVVADEIRELAERTASSTKEIASLIRGVQAETKTAVLSMEEGSKSAIEGVGLIDDVDKTLQKVTQMTKEIARATQEQTRGGEQIMKSVENMRDMAVQVKKATVEQSKGAKQISKTSEDGTSMARSILISTKEEARGSALIVKSIENVKEITSTNLEMLSKLDEMINTLNEQSSISGKEIEKFKIEK